MLNKITLLVFYIILAGCQSMADIQMHIQAQKPLNAFSAKESTPVLLRIYQLTEDDAFLGASFQELWKADRAALGSSWVARKEIVISPGKKDTILIPRKPEAYYLGIIALFKSPDAGQWRVIRPLTHRWAIAGNRVKIKLHKNRLTIDS